MKNNKINLEEFVSTTHFSDDIDKQVFRELVTKYKKETPRQALIRAIIAMWERKYPLEAHAHQRTIEHGKETRINKFAANKEQDQRLLFRFPQSLWNRLTLLVKDPDFLYQSDPITKGEKKELEWVIKNFPQYLIPSQY